MKYDNQSQDGFMTWLTIALATVLGLIAPAGYFQWTTRDWVSTSGCIESAAPQFNDGSYSVEGTYLYEVDGVTYRGSCFKVERDALGSTSGGAQIKAARDFPMGKPTKVWYDPDFKRGSCLERGDYTWTWPTLGFLAFMSLMVLAVYGARSRKHLLGALAWMAIIVVGAMKITFLVSTDDLPGQDPVVEEGTNQLSFLRRIGTLPYRGNDIPKIPKGTPLSEVLRLWGRPQSFQVEPLKLVLRYRDNTGRDSLTLVRESVTEDYIVTSLSHSFAL